MSRFSRSHRLLPQGWEIRKDLGGKEKRMLHQQNRQNDRGPDEATTEGLGPWNRVASGPESSSTESSDLAMGDAVSRVRSSEARISAPSLHAGDQAIPTSPLESSLPIGRKIVSSLSWQTVTHVVASSLLGLVMRSVPGETWLDNRVA
ncbi:hypothetical protein THAOC_12797 [Thalassiosira oceanica]|uniref:Uncharacterized protein n=1 Tax=Thalassiosira oceanica TaxID=159749 RepID=K0SLV4_THAOC|nr:hypothetical protein THAOC_12797 [Thalassiosira oceanica]|eukprot:EJK66295.1 hypothetical protein THAOC_12797 [Thalassiosira oceanica]